MHFHLRDGMLTAASPTGDGFSQHGLGRSLVIHGSDRQCILRLGDQVVQLPGGNTSVHFQLGESQTPAH